MARQQKPLNVFGLAVPVVSEQGLFEQGMFGYFDDELKKVGVDSRLKGRMLNHTTIHELFHAALDRIHVQPLMEEKLVEIIVENLTVALLDNYEVKRKK